ncbi:MAG: sulfatase [Proteobacteria bacterium]|nr:sulfatase [Pseudomonadota bacterium]
MVSVDTLRADHLSVYGYGEPTTPELASFFPDDGIFATATTGAPCTKPSVRQILSSTYDARAITLPVIFHARGYETAAIVSQHVFYRRLAEYRRGFEHWDIQPKHRRDRYKMTTRTADEVTDRALRWVEQRTSTRPFFLWLHYFDPHDPYSPHADFEQFDTGGGERFADGDRRGYQRRLGKQLGRIWYKVDEFDPAERRRLIGLYDGEIAFTDAHVGRALQGLERAGGSHETIFVLLSDHGERLGEKGVWDHCFTVQEVETRVPLLFRVPGASPFPPDTRQQRVSTLDVMPTLLDLLGIPFAHLELHGQSLLEPGPRRAVSIWRKLAAIRQGDWKLYCRIKRKRCVPRKLARLGQGVSEEVVEGHDDVREALLRALARVPGVNVRASDVAERELEQLRALGYTE